MLNEATVLKMHKDGYSNRAIARTLGNETQESTVRGILKRNNATKDKKVSHSLDDKVIWHDGCGIQPVDNNIMVEVKLRSGDILSGKSKDFDFNLSDRKYRGDILSWRILPKQTLNCRGALYQLTLVTNAVRFFTGDIKTDDQHLNGLYWEFPGYYGVVLNPSLKSMVPPLPENGHPLLLSAHIYTKQGVYLKDYFRSSLYHNDIPTEEAKEWWGFIRDYVMDYSDTYPRVKSVSLMYKEEIEELDCLLEEDKSNGQ